MIAQIIKKNALILLRNPVQLLLLIGLPMILIAILGTALGSWMSGEEIEIKLKLAIIENESESEQIEHFIADLEASNLPEEAVKSMKTAAESVQPAVTLKEVLQSEELDGMIELEEAMPKDLTSLQEDNSYAAIIEIPEGFTYELLNQLFLEEGSSPDLIVYQNEEQEIAGSIVNQIITEYQEQFTLGGFLGEKGINPEELTSLATEFKQEVSTIDQQNPVSSKAYYTIGMVVMNVLFMATTIGSISFEEKGSHVFDRIILADVSRWLYFIGVLLSGMIFAFIQSTTVFTFAYLVFGVAWPNLGAFFITTILFSLAVGGLSVLLTAISYSTNSEQVISFFSSIVVTLLAFLGGSFFPIGDSSSFIQKLGDFTPNGAAMSAYLSIIRGGSVMDISHHLIYILFFSLIAIIIGVLSFPKRGAAS